MQARYFLGLIASSAALWAPVAIAQQVCNELARLSQAALDGFADLKGPKIQRDADDPDGKTECCYANLNLPGANFCTVKPSIAWDEGMRYTCHWMFEPGQQEKTAQVFSGFSKAITACLSPNAWQDESSADQLKYRASLDGGHRIGSIELTSSTGGSRYRRPAVTFSFETYPTNSGRRRR